MKKGFAVLGMIMVVVAITYTAFDWQNIRENTTQEIVSLVNGTKIELNAEEASLPIAQGEKKVVITDLGMV
jgi:FtsH-binding integral membrane protein